MVDTCDELGLFKKGPATPMGLALGDIDGDGSLEMHLAMTENDALLTSAPDHVWANARGTIDMPEPTTSTSRAVVAGEYQSGSSVS